MIELFQPGLLATVRGRLAALCSGSLGAPAEWGLVYRLLNGLESGGAARQALITDLDAPLAKSILEIGQGPAVVFAPLEPAAAAVLSSLFQDAQSLLGSLWEGMAEGLAVYSPLVLAGTSADGRPGGASRPDLLGVTFMRPDAAWSVTDCAECLLHEAVHHALFLWDVSEGIFTEVAGSAEDTLSPVRTVYPSGGDPLRKYASAFHAACVADALIAFYEKLSSPRAVDFTEPMAAGIDGLRRQPWCLAPFGQLLLERLSSKYPAGQSIRRG